MGEWSERLRSAVAVAVGAEAVLATAGALYLTVGLFTDEATEFTAAVFQAVLAWLLVAALGLLAVGVWGRRAWARGPVITVQLLAVPVALGMLNSEKWYLGVGLMTAALVGLAGVHPSVLGRAGGDEQRDAGRPASQARATRPR